MSVCDRERGGRERETKREEERAREAIGKPVSELCQHKESVCRSCLPYRLGTHSCTCTHARAQGVETGRPVSE